MHHEGIKAIVPRPLWPAAGACLKTWRWIQTSRPAVTIMRYLARPDTAAWRWETEPLAPSGKLCVFVTYSPAGQIPERAIRHAAIWRNAGYEVLFVIALDEYSSHPTIPFGHAICRENKGHDFAAWSRALTQVPLNQCNIVATVNDSVFTNDKLTSAIKRAEADPADVVGFTECREYRWHLQSYALMFKGNCVRSEVFRRFWQPRIGSRRHVILTYEIQLARTMCRAGYDLTTLYPLKAADNPTIHHWPELLELGYPYLKRSEFPRKREAWLPLIAAHGFDVGFILHERPI